MNDNQPTFTEFNWDVIFLAPLRTMNIIKVLFEITTLKNILPDEVCSIFSSHTARILLERALLALSHCAMKMLATSHSAFGIMSWFKNRCEQFREMGIGNMGTCSTYSDLTCKVAIHVSTDNSRVSSFFLGRLHDLILELLICISRWGIVIIKSVINIDSGFVLCLTVACS